MKILMTSTKDFEEKAFKNVLCSSDFKDKLEFIFTETVLNAETADIAKGADVVCVFVSDNLNAECLKKLKENKVKLVVLRSAGFNHVDLNAARELGIPIMRVPRYSPQAVAEFTVGLYLSLNRKIHRAHDRVREGNFSLKGLVGRDVHKQTIGVIGTGNIGRCVAQIFRGFGAQVVAYDISPNITWAEKHGVRYAEWQEILETSDVLSLHIPLSKQTHHIINKDSIGYLKKGAYLINTSRGGLIETSALIEALKSQQLSGAALDVYEEEEHYFFKDLSDLIVNDDILARLMTFPNVLITSHQAFLTEEALSEIALVTIKNILDWVKGIKSTNTL